MKKLFALLVASLAGVAFGDPVNQEMLDRLDDLQRQVIEQQAEIDRLRELIEKPPEETPTDRANQFDEYGSDHHPNQFDFFEIGPVEIYRPHLEAIIFTGDLELGWLHLNHRQPAWPEDGSDRSSSLHTRLRLGALWQTSEWWEIGAGLVTGRSQDRLPVRRLFYEENLNHGWSRRNPFGKDSIELDYAYSRHSFDTASLTIGQQANPFITSTALWDSRARPTGVTGHYQFEGLSTTIGWYEMFNLGLHGDPDLRMWAGQIGYEAAMERVDLTIATAYYRISSRLDRPPLRLHETRSTTNSDTIDYRANTADLFIEIKTTMEPLSLTGQGHLWHNFKGRGETDSQVARPFRQTTPRNNDTGFLLGVSGQLADFRAGYAYSRVGADSFARELVDEFHPVNARGHRLELGYQLTTHLQLCGQYRRLRELDGEGKLKLYQINLNYEF